MKEWLRLLNKEVSRNIYTICNFFIHFLGIVSILASIKIYHTGFKGELTELQSQILLSFLLSIAASYIFFFYSIYYPNRILSRIKKRNFALHLEDFKCEVIGTFLQKLNYANDEALAQKLSSVKEFREFFKANHVPDQNRWDFILTELDTDNDFRNNILFQLDILKDECSYMLNNIEIHNFWVFSFLKQINFVIASVKTDSVDSTDRMASFLWELFSGWSYVKGYTDIDMFMKVSKNL